MLSLIPSFFAGVLTVAAPCVLPVLPVILGGSVASTSGSTKSKATPALIIAGLGVSITIFTLLLKASTSLLGVPQFVWQAISAGIIFLFGLTFVFPEAWSQLSTRLGFQQGSDHLLNQASHETGPLGSLLLGAALGPVFTSCSPTYALIVAVILPQSFSQGIAHLLTYVLGLSITLLTIALLGRTVTKRIRVLANPQGNFRKVIGILLIATALLILTGYDKKFQTFVLENGWYDPIAKLEGTTSK